MAENGFPTSGVELTHILVTADIDRARSFYKGVLGASVYRQYGGDSCVLQFQGSWLLLVTGGEVRASGRFQLGEPFHDDPRTGLSPGIQHPQCPGRRFSDASP